MGKHETEALRLIMMRVSEMGYRCWRNNRGLFYSKTGIPVMCGLANGSGDLIGIVDGRFLSIEVKSAIGDMKKHQEQWRKMVNDNGGIGICARTPDEAEEKINDALSSDKSCTS